MPRFDEGRAAAVAAALRGRIEPLCSTLLPGGRRVGAEWECGDLSGRPGRSLKVCLRGDKAGIWSDFAEDVGGDALDLVAAVRGESKAEALAWARDWLGHAPFVRGNPAFVPAPMSRYTSVSRQRAARRLWDEARPIQGSLAEIYLGRRGLTLPSPIPDLRFHPACRHPDGRCFPAMVAAVRNAGGDLVAVYRTFLRRDGLEKAPVSPPRAALGPLRGAAVRLGAAAGDLVAAEGIETALAGSLLMDGTPALATLGSSGLTNLVLPALPVAAHVLIFADGDKAGVRAAQIAAQRFRVEGRHVWVLRAPPECDANDVLRLPELRGATRRAAESALAAP